MIFYSLLCQYEVFLPLITAFSHVLHVSHFKLTTVQSKKLIKLQYLNGRSLVARRRRSRNIPRSLRETRSFGISFIYLGCKGLQTKDKKNNKKRSIHLKLPRGFARRIPRETSVTRGFPQATTLFMYSCCLQWLPNANFNKTTV
jgi:hypothetical protein